MGDNDVHVGSSVLTKVPLYWPVLITGKAMYARRLFMHATGIWAMSELSSKFCMKLKML